MEQEEQWPFSILREIFLLMLNDLFRLKNLKKHQFGGEIKLEISYFSPSLAQYLWLSLNQPYPSNISLVGKNIHCLNYYFGPGIYSTSGWCFHNELNLTTWMVDSVELSYYSNGKLSIQFHTIRMNHQGQKLLVL